MADIQTLLGDAYKEGMSLEEINAALESKDFISKESLSSYVPKNIADQYASEAAEFKKKWKATQTAQELKAIEEAEKNAAMVQELESLRRSSAIADYEKNHLSLGYDSKSAKEISEALYDGDMETVFNIQKRFQENKEKSIKAELMKSMPTPPSGNGSGTVDFSKQIEEAKATGNFALYASLIRQQNEANVKATL